MKEILFKAKRIDNGEWVEGYLYKKYFQELPHDRFVIEYKTTGSEYEWTPKYMVAEVDPETLCQYTGLTDKNSNKIWENDVVKCYADTDDLGNDLYFFYEVIWHESYHCWWLSDIHTLEDEYLHEYNPSDIEVIGNIFDSPELLKGSESDG